MPSYRINFIGVASLAALTASLVGAQTVYWNPSLPLLNSGGELHKAYNWTENQDGTGAWPKSAQDDDFTSSTLTGWLWVNTTGTAATGTVNGGQLTLTARGADLWRDTSQFAAWYKTFSDTFDISVKVVSQTRAHGWSKAGILIANNLADLTDGGGFAVMVTPDHGIKVQFDSTVSPVGLDIDAPAVAVVSYPVWLRATRKGGAYYAYYRTSLTNPWTPMGRAVPLNPTATVQAGLFASSHTINNSSTVVFDDFQSGGPLSASNLDLAFNGTSATADSNARLTSNFAAQSLSLTGYSGLLSFRASTLTLAGNADFSTTSTLDPGAGVIAFGTGVQTLTPPPVGATLPAISKSGSGTLTIATRALKAGILSIAGGSVDLGAFSHEFAGLASTGGALTGLTGAETVTFSGSADFSGLSALPNAAEFRFPAGNQTLKAKAGTVLPAITKLGGGTLTLDGSSLAAGILTVTGSTVNLNARSHAFAGLGGTTATLSGLTAADTLALLGNADFSGFVTLPSAGTVQIRSVGNAVSPRDVSLVPGPAAFNHLVLWPIPSTFPARVAIGAGNLAVNGNLTLRDEKGAAGLTGIVDFRGGNAAVTVAGNLAVAANGAEAGSSSLQLRMGDGKWTASGNVSLSAPAGLSADKSTLELSGAGVQALGAGASTLGAVSHTGTGTVTLQGGVPLKAAAFSQTAGALILNGSNLDVTGAITVSNGGAVSLQGLGGRELKAGGNISFSGTAGSPLSLNPVPAWSVSAGGTLSADFADIGNSAATGTEGSATAACVDRDGNSRWKFTPPTVSQQPNSPEALAGAKAAFTVKATGSGPLIYAWRKRGEAPVLATEALLEVTATPALHGARYYCTVTNSAGAAESLDGVLTVNEPVSVTTQPPNDTAVLGQPASFAFVAAGTGPIQYRWRKTGDTNTVDTNAVFSIAKTTEAQDGASWTCTISNAFGSAVTGAAGLHILYPPRFAKHPAAADVAEGKIVRFEASASGTGTLSFAWFRQGEPDTLGKDSVLDLKLTLADSGKKLFCTALNTYGQASSQLATLTVGQKPGIDLPPADITVHANLPATFKVRATGTGPLAFAWLKVGQPDTLVRDSTLVIPPVTRSDSGARYYCRISNKYGDTLTREAQLHVVRPPTKVREPADLIIVAGQPARFTVGISGSDPLQYAWTKIGDTTVLSPDSSYTIAVTSMKDSNTLYQCRITNPFGSVLTREARLTVVQAALILREPVSASVAPGKKAVFSVGAVGAQPMTFAWYRKGVTAAVSQDTVFTIDSVKLIDDGAIYRVIVTNSFGADTSREVKLNVVTCDSVFTTFLDTVTVDEGQPVTLTGKAACANGRQWSVVSGPASPILDPEVDTLIFKSPRVAADTVTVYRFSAEYATGWVHKDVVVKVRGAIPDPKFSLPAPVKWNGGQPYAVRPTLTNRDALQASPYSPPFRYQWFLSVVMVDTLQAADSLVLSNPGREGNLDVTLCMDNGGTVNCVIHSVSVAFASTRLAERAARLGSVSLQGRLLSWNADASARVWSFDGRLLWQGRGRAGGTALIPDAAARDMFRGRARLEILK